MSECNYSLSEENRKEFAGIYVLEYMINRPAAFDVFLQDNDQDLEPVLLWLMVKEYVEIKDEVKYVPTDKGRQCIVKFLERYSEFLTMFDVFSAVDLSTGEFAFASYFEIDDRDGWRDYLDDERWEDLRIAVADFKGLAPVEIVFMSFINESRFGRDANGWQFDLLLGSVWEEILEICNTALHVEELGYEDGDDLVKGQDVLADVIVQGTELMIGLLEKEDAIAAVIPHDTDPDDDMDDSSYVEGVEYDYHPPAYYQPYRDPFYVSPVWLAIWLL